jgi:hypothetical protein
MACTQRCRTGKKQYHGEDEAKKALTRIKQDLVDVRERTPVRVYRCPFCKRWHLTSQPEDRGRVSPLAKGA